MMAVPLNAFKSSLDKLGCPYTEGVEESWITELIFKPGEARIRLLQWLFAKFDSSLNDVLDPQCFSVESKMDSRIQRLLYVASTVGLCRYDDVDLIRGVVPAGRQSAFMEQLIDLVCIADVAEDPQNMMHSEPGLVGEEMCLEDQLSHDITYLNSVCGLDKIDHIFNSKITLLPPDLQKLVKDSWAEKGHPKDRPPKPDLQAIETSALQLADDIERQTELLTDLRKIHDYQPYDESKLETICRTISLVLSELSQLVTGFTYCYENEMKHWCNKQAPALTQLGPAFKRVHRLLQQFIQMIQGLKMIRTSYTALNKDASDRLSGVPQGTATDLGQIGMTALGSLQEVIDVLDDSVQHSKLNDSGHSTSTPKRGTTKFQPDVTWEMTFVDGSST